MPSYKEFYRIDKKPLGDGGFARVLRGTHRDTGDVHAIKVLKVRDEEALKRFKREVTVQSSVDHPNVMPIVAHSIPDGWYSMPLASRAFCEAKRPVPDGDLLALVRHIAAGLAAAHAKGFVHRDIKPANVLELSLVGGIRWAVSDWGLVRKPVGHTTVALTVAQQSFGTYAFAAPEMWDDAHKADARVDIYGLGRVVTWATSPKVQLKPNIQHVPDGAWARFIDATTKHDAADRPGSISELAPFLLDVERTIVGLRSGRFYSAIMQAGCIEDFRRIGGALWAHLPRGVRAKGWFWASYHSSCGRPGYYTKDAGAQEDLVVNLIDGLLAQQPKVASGLLASLPAGFGLS